MTSLIIVDYHSMEKTMEYIRQCVSKIMDSHQMHIIIVDNSDNPDMGLNIINQEAKSVEKIAVAHIRQEVYAAVYGEYSILYVCARENLGYAKGNNLGARVSQSYYQDSYYLFSNNDLRFTEAFSLAQLEEPMKDNPGVAVVGPRILGMNREAQSPRRLVSAGNRLFLYYIDLLLPKGFKIHSLSDVVEQETNGICDWVTGSFLCVDARKFHSVDGFDEHTFLYFEESILSARLLQRGYHMYYDGDITLIHEHGQTVQSSMKVLDGIRLSFQSSLYYYTTYRGTGKSTEIFAKIFFKLFAIAFRCKKRLGKRIDS